MKPFSLLAMMLCALMGSSCGQHQSARTNTAPAPPQVGSLYSLNDGEGGFRVGKVLAFEEDVVFVQLFSQRWTAPPTVEKARQATLPSGIAFLSQSFAGMQPVRLEAGNVSPEELQLYEAWKQSRQDVF